MDIVYDTVPQRPAAKASGDTKEPPATGDTEEPLACKDVEGSEVGRLRSQIVDGLFCYYFLYCLFLDIRIIF